MINVKEIKEIEISNPERLEPPGSKEYFENNPNSKAKLFIHNSFFYKKNYYLGYIGIESNNTIKEIPMYIYVFEETEHGKFKILASTINEADELGISVVISSIANWNFDNPQNRYVNIFYHDIDSNDFIKRKILF